MYNNIIFMKIGNTILKSDINILRKGKIYISSYRSKVGYLDYVGFVSHDIFLHVD